MNPFSGFLALTGVNRILMATATGLSILLVGGVLLASQTASKEAHRLVTEEGALLLDVRTPEEFAEGHLPGALNIPVDQVAKRLDEVGPKDKPVVVYCRTGRRSGLAAVTLEKAGFQSVHDLGAMSAW